VAYGITQTSVKHQSMAKIVQVQLGTARCYHVVTMGQKHCVISHVTWMTNR